jgi:hypothetical protein
LGFLAIPKQRVERLAEGQAVAVDGKVNDVAALWRALSAEPDALDEVDGETVDAATARTRPDKLDTLTAELVIAEQAALNRQGVRPLDPVFGLPRSGVESI